MKVFAFARYYLKLRVTLALKMRHTSNPLDVKWRWRHWKKMESLKSRAR